MDLVTTRRRYFIAFLLGIAIVGALLLTFAEPDSDLRQAGALMMVVWIPIGFWIIQLLFGSCRTIYKAHKYFGFFTKFEMHMRAQVALEKIPYNRFYDYGRYVECIIAHNKDGYTSRFQLSQEPGVWEGKLQEVNVQFKVPQTALQKLQAGDEFQIVIDQNILGRGQLL